MQLIPLGNHGDYFLPYFKNGKALTKSFIISFIEGKPKYIDYLLDNAKLEKLSKDFLYSVRFFYLYLAYCLPRAWCACPDVRFDKKKSAENVNKK